MKIKFFIFMILLAALVLTIPGTPQLQQIVSETVPTLVLVVDAGHGGPDGGASGADGTEEKDINLAIAKAVEEEGARRGIEVFLTRKDNQGLYAEDNVDGPWRKLDDMKQRKEIIESSGAHGVISIHLNSFPSDTNVRGAQVFYPTMGNPQIAEESQKLAGAIQTSLVTGLQDGSNRIEMAKNDIYLFEEALVPTVLVECGFLSNPKDLENLKKEQYRKKLASCILNGIEEYFSKEQNN